MSDRSMVRLTQVIERVHSAKATFVGSIGVREQFEGKTVRQGLVSQFKMIRHPTADSSYAWSVPPIQGCRERYYAVLRTPEIDSPEKAVCASIVAASRAKTAGGSR